MVTLPNANKILKITYSGTYGAAKWANIFHCRYTGTLSTSADATSILNQAATAWTAHLGTVMGGAASLSTMTLFDLTSPTSVQAVTNPSASGTTTGTGAMPASVAVVVSFKIGRRYRGGHPRMYLTGQFTSNTANLTSWAAGWPGTVNAAAAAWITSINAITTTGITLIEVGNLSYYSGKTLRGTPAFDPFIASAVHGRIDSQRRRLGRETP